MADNNLTADKIKKLSDLVNIRRISDLETFQGNNSDTSFLNNSYLLTSSYISNKYVNYKLKIDDIIKYLNEQGNADLKKLINDFDSFISSIVQNTENSYIKFVSLSNELDEYSYTIEPKYSTINNGINPFSYIDGKSTYAYTNVLSDGIITNNVLEEYVRETLGRILGVPSTPAHISEAVDSVIEFVDWFKGYVRNDTSYGSLQNLINTIEAKDDEILNEAKSYTVENRELTYSYTVENRELTYAYVESSYNLLYSTIQDIDVDVPVKGVSATNKITIGNVTYILDLDDNKNLQLSVDVDNFVPFDVSVSGGSTTDYESYTYINEKNNITLTATANKECTWNNWTTTSDGASTGQSTQSSDGKTLTATGAHDTIGYCISTTTFSWKISALHTPTQDEQDHGHRDTEDSGEKPVSVKYTFNKFKSAVFASPQGIDDISFTEISYQPQTITTYGGSWKTVSTLPSSFGSFNVNSSNENCYIYFLLPSNWVVSGKGFKWTGGEGMAETPGTANIRTLKLYNETKNYTLFRSENKYPNGKGINFEYV